jgi:hypothetical protein
VAQLAIDDDNYFYIAYGATNLIKRQGPYPRTDELWRFDMKFLQHGSGAYAVSVDGEMVYCMKGQDNNVIVLDRLSGVEVSRFQLQFGAAAFENFTSNIAVFKVFDQFVYVHGGLTNNTVYRFDASTGVQTMTPLVVTDSRVLQGRGFVFTGRDICMSKAVAGAVSTTPVNSTVLCYRLLDYGRLDRRTGGALDVYGAAAGTSYREESFREPKYSEVKYSYSLNLTLLAADFSVVHVDCEGVNVPWPTVIMENNTYEYEFDEMELTGWARLVFYRPGGVNALRNVTVTVHTFVGDRTGLLHLRGHQTAFFEYYSAYNLTEMPCSFDVDFSSTGVFPKETYIRGVRSEMHGKMSGIEELNIGNGGMLVMHSTAQTSNIINETEVDISDLGSFEFGILRTKRNGTLRLDFVPMANQAMFLRVGDLDVKYQSILYLDNGTLIVGFVNIESEGILTAVGTGDLANVGTGRGSGVGGGGHGGSAGLATGAFGRPYGAIEFPNLPGSGGATSGGTPNITCQSTPWIDLPCLSGSGGGIIRIIVGNNFLLDGLLEAGGAHGYGSAAGGGSGGSIYIKAFNFTGHGDINTDGGNGTGAGGGGSGGRIALLIDFDLIWGGEYQARGGAGGALLLSQHSQQAQPAPRTRTSRPRVRSTEPSSTTRH